jgi:hypothetical protein
VNIEDLFDALVDEVRPNPSVTADQARRRAQHLGRRRFRSVAGVTAVCVTVVALVVAISSHDLLHADRSTVGVTSPSATAPPTSQSTPSVATSTTTSPSTLPTRSASPTVLSDKVYFLPYSGSAGARTIRPRAADFDHTDWLTKMTWTSWGSRRASGSGTGWRSDCDPDCAHGHYGHRPVTVTLSRPIEACGITVFSRMVLGWPNGEPLGRGHVEVYTFSTEGPDSAYHSHIDCS